MTEVVTTAIICFATYAICVVIYVYGYKKNKKTKKHKDNHDSGLLSQEDNNPLIRITDTGKSVEHSEIVDYVLRYERLKESGTIGREIEKLENINFSEYSNMLNLKESSYEGV